MYSIVWMIDAWKSDSFLMIIFNCLEQYNNENVLHLKLSTCIFPTSYLLFFKFNFQFYKLLIRLNLEIQLTIKISEKTGQRRFGVILAPFSS